MENRISICNIGEHTAMDTPPPRPESKLEDKLFTILDLQADMALLAAKLANGGSIAHFLC